METVVEEWRSVKGFDGFYEVSNLGQVRSLSRWVKRGAGMAMAKGKVLTPQHSMGYPNVVLSAAALASRRIVKIHCLVAEAFLGDRPPSHDVNHKNGIKTDNRVANLEYSTRSENNLHALKMGLRVPSRLPGEKHPMAKLCDRDVIEIRARRPSESSESLAREFGVAATCINSIARRHTWRHVP